MITQTILCYRLDNPNYCWVNPMDSFKAFLVERGEDIFWDVHLHEIENSVIVAPYHWQFPNMNLGYIYLDIPFRYAEGIFLESLITNPS